MSRITVVGGCGHVGLPLSLALAAKGHEVCVHDVNEAAIEGIKKGKMPFVEKGSDELLAKVLASGSLTFSTDAASITRAEAVIVVVGTPVDQHLNPQVKEFLKLMERLGGFFRDGQVLILRSTVFPGTTDRVQDYFNRQGRRVDVAFCPERIAEGHAIEELESLPQIISGCTPAAVAGARGVFSWLTTDFVELRPLEAELAKLFTNTYRYITFSIANQFYEIANDHGLDFYSIYRAMTHHYPRTKNMPKPGFAAGPCLFKDTMQLAAFSNNNFFLGHSAMLVNEGLPNYIVQDLKRRVNLTDRVVGILGMAFKAESDDKRESLSYKLRTILAMEAKEVLCSDVYIDDEGFVSADELLDKSDIVILGAPHREYGQLDLKGKEVVDIWHFFQRQGVQ